MTGMNPDYLGAMHRALSLATPTWREIVLAAVASQDFRRIQDTALAAYARGERELGDALRRVNQFH